MSNKIRARQKGRKVPCRLEVEQTPQQKAADERRLRKLKIFLQSVSYNGSERESYGTLNDLYNEVISRSEPPCSGFTGTTKFTCEPTPFLVACCFNRSRVIPNTKPLTKKRNIRKIFPRQPTDKVCLDTYFKKDLAPETNQSKPRDCQSQLYKREPG